MSNQLWIPIMAIDTILTLLFLYLLLTSGRYAPRLSAIKGDIRCIAGTGYWILELFKVQTSGNMMRKKLQQYQVLYGKKYGEFYLGADLAKMISLTWLVLIVFLPLGVALRQGIILLLIFVLAGIPVYYYLTIVPEKIAKRNEEISDEYPELLSKMALLVNAGMITTEAWTKIANDGDGLLYEEMRATDDEIRNGTSIRDAYLNFSERCMNEDITKFASTMLQNLEKANEELSLFLRDYSREAWNTKKQRALQKGQAASSKLMIPITMIFIGIMVMIMIPMFSNMNY